MAVSEESEGVPRVVSGIQRLSRIRRVFALVAAITLLALAGSVRPIRRMLSTRPPIEHLIESVSHQKHRLIESRLSGLWPYAPFEVRGDAAADAVSRGLAAELLGWP